MAHEEWSPDSREPIADVRGLRDYVLSLRLVPSAERPVEGLHAQTKREVSRVPNHSTSLVSLAHRLPYLHAHMETRAALEKFADLLATVPHGLSALRALGLQDHPECGRGGERSSKTCDIIYRADGYSKYRMPAPKISLVEWSQRPQSSILLEVSEQGHTVKRDAIIAHVASKLQADGTCYSLPLGRAAFVGLKQVLSGSCPENEDAPTLPFPPSANTLLLGGEQASQAALQATLSDVAFFTVVDSGLSRAVRTKVSSSVWGWAKKSWEAWAASQSVPNCTTLRRDM